MVAADDVLEKAVEAALEAGYRHFDTARAYENEAALGRALNRWIGGDPERRKQLFVVTKLPPGGNRPELVQEYFDASLRDLNLEYVDLYLMHTPFAFQHVPGDLHPKNPDGSMKVDHSTNLLELWKVYHSPITDRQCKVKQVEQTTISKQPYIQIDTDQLQGHENDTNIQACHIVPTENVSTSMTSFVKPRQTVAARINKWYKMTFPKLLCPCCTGGDDTLATYRARNAAGSYESIDLKHSNNALHSLDLDASLMSIIHMHRSFKPKRTPKKVQGHVPKPLNAPRVPNIQHRPNKPRIPNMPQKPDVPRVPNRPRVTKVPRENRPNVPRGNGPNVPRGNRPNVPRGNRPNAPRVYVSNVPRRNVPNLPRGNIPNVPRGNVPTVLPRNESNVSNVPKNIKRRMLETRPHNGTDVIQTNVCYYTKTALNISKFKMMNSNDVIRTGNFIKNQGKCEPSLQCIYVHEDHPLHVPSDHNKLFTPNSTRTFGQCYAAPLKPEPAHNMKQSRGIFASLFVCCLGDKGQGAKHIHRASTTPNGRKQENVHVISSYNCNLYDFGCQYSLKSTHSLEIISHILTRSNSNISSSESENSAKWRSRKNKKPRSLSVMMCTLARKLKEKNSKKKDNVVILRIPKQFSNASNTGKTLLKLKESGRVRHVGVSNLNAEQLARVCSVQRPACLQVEVHALCQQQALLAAANKLGVPLVAYSPLGSKALADALAAKTGREYPDLLQLPVVTRIAQAHGRTPAQILLRYTLQRGLAAIPKSTNPARIKQNITLWDFELSGSELSELAALDRGEEGRICDFTFFPGIEKHPEFPFRK
ncbi:hypothetical protein HW555_007718 [Spodoptera exigua]|uniref:NADP-dependent oxidoreductase domain-containing protein n=1 Tax=Spodoptera exigua TaxID=7107 RepID=A0A835GFJ0_SPOEX|nr:hypothetical protein HW555_007718 [Spodoptera exigua]